MQSPPPFTSSSTNPTAFERNHSAVSISTEIKPPNTNDYPPKAQSSSSNMANLNTTSQNANLVPSSSSGPPPVPSPTFSPLSPTSVHPNTRMQTDLMRALEQPFPNLKGGPNQTIGDSYISNAAPTESIAIPNVSGIF